MGKPWQPDNQCWQPTQLSHSQRQAAQQGLKWAEREKEWERAGSGQFRNASIFPDICYRGFSFEKKVSCGLLNSLIYYLQLSLKMPFYLRKLCKGTIKPAALKCQLLFWAHRRKWLEMIPRTTWPMLIRHAKSRTLWHWGWNKTQIRSDGACPKPHAHLLTRRGCNPSHVHWPPIYRLKPFLLWGSPIERWISEMRVGVMKRMINTLP